MNNSPIIIDLSYLYSITGGDKKFEKLLLTGAVADVNAKITALNESWLARDAAGIKLNAHSLITLAAIAGMPQVEKWCRVIDQAFSDGGFHEELSASVYNIITGWPNVKTQLDNLVA